MAGLSYPSVLVPENWNKQKGVPPKSPVADALADLKKAHAGIDNRLLETGKLKTAEGVQERIDELNTELKKSVKAAVDAAKDAVTAAKKAEGEYKKQKDNPKEASAAAAAVIKAAGSYGDDVVGAVQSTLAELATRLAKLEAEEKKNAKDDKDDEAETADEKFVRNRVVSAMKIVKAAKAGAKPMLFMIGMGKTHVMPYMWYSVGGSHRTMLTRLMPGESGIKFFKGECIWEEKAFTFIGETIPTGGFAKKLQKGLQELTNIKYRVRSRRPEGDAEEGEGGGDGEDEQQQVAAADAAAKNKPDQGADFNHRLAELQPQIREGLAGPRGADIKNLVATMGQRAQKKDFETALKQLDEIKALLRSAAGAEQPGGVDPAKAFNARLGALVPKVKAAGGELGKQVTTLAAQAGQLAGDKSKDGVTKANALLDKIETMLGAAAGAKAAAQSGDAGAGSAASPKLASEWASARKDAVDGIEALAKKIQEEYRDEVDQKAQVAVAVGKLRTLSGKLQDGLDKQLGAALAESDPAKRAALARTAKATLASIAKVVVEDPLMAELDGNELLPDLKIVAPLKAKLREIATALG